ncbi:Dihydrolipoyllysine-residue succinyltransferase component of 2-oxoglutarate dehydrogenase complex, mitochondrial [Exaiptasia diaphana]|nr:Dihydrolipoyllysine-residue succinyltransferase component of 2-oxoglutarate dehydrogenase complex, mitochondrial [Exaiptasia diaphana]
MVSYSVCVSEKKKQFRYNCLTDLMQEKSLTKHCAKTSIPVTAPASGIIEELFVSDGDKVERDQQLFKLKITGEAPKKETPEPTVSEPATPTSPPPPSPAAEPVVRDIPSSAPPVPPLPTAPLHEIKPSVPTPVAMPTATVDVPVKGARSEHRKHGIKLGFMSAFVKAAAFALQSEPVVNAVIEGNEIVYRDYVDISVAVSTPKGLVVPVIRNVETMNYTDIERAINLLGEKARNNELAIEDMDGGTFTISNGGVFGSLMGTPIINPPQSAILGMHAINDRPVAVNGKVEIRPMMYVALTYDHRLIDGREAVTFLRKIKAAVEDPRVILMDL